MDDDKCWVPTIEDEDQAMFYLNQYLHLYFTDENKTALTTHTTDKMHEFLTESQAKVDEQWKEQMYTLLNTAENRHKIINQLYHLERLFPE